MRDPLHRLGREAFKGATPAGRGVVRDGGAIVRSQIGALRETDAHAPGAAS